jgi:hypothetical protein
MANIPKVRATVLVFFLSCIFWTVLNPNPASAEGACKCSGTISAGMLLPNSTFDSYCPQAKGHCQTCGGGVAHCETEVPLSEAECKEAASNPSKFGEKLGIPSAAFALLNISGTCTFGGSPEGTTGGAAQGDPPAPSQGIIPAEVAGCIKTGNCSLDDIVRTGVGFANFLMGLSGALFLAIFIYGGALYLLSFGNKEYVTKGMKAIKGAAIGMIIVLSAWTIVGQIVKGIGADVSGAGTAATGKKGITATSCTDLGPEWTCKTFDGSTSAQVVQNASKAGFQCQTGKCLPSNDVHTICCKEKK